MGVKITKEYLDSIVTLVADHPTYTNVQISHMLEKNDGYLSHLMGIHYNFKRRIMKIRENALEEKLCQKDIQ